MNTWIWSRSDLIQLSRHKAPLVRRWACERLRTLYGKPSDEVLERLLRDRDREVLLEVLRYMETYPEPKLKDTVLRLYETKTGSIAGRCALLLGLFKDDRLISTYENKTRGKEVDFDEMSWTLDSMGKLGTDQAKDLLKKILSEITEDNDPFLIPSVIHALLEAKEDFSVLLEEYARFYQKWGMEILYPFSSVCGSWHSLKDLKGEGKKKLWRESLAPAVADSLKYLENKGFTPLAKDLRQAFSKKDYRQVMAIAWQWTEKALDEKGERAREQLLIPSDSPPLVNYQVLKAFKEYLGKGPEDSFKGIATAALIILSAFIEFRNLLGLRVEKMDPQSMFPVLFEDRDALNIDDLLMERILAQNDRQTIFDHCIRQLQDHPNSYGTERAFKLLGGLRDPKAIPSLLDFLKRKGNDSAIDQCIQAMVQMGSPLVDYLEKNFDQLNPDQLFEILFALKDIPEEKTADLILLHWDKLWSIGKEPLLYALEGVASKRFIEPLRKELREGEELEEEVFYLLCHLHGVNDILLPQIEKNLAEKKKQLEKTSESMQKNGSAALRQNTAKVELRCRRCGKSYHYKVGNIYILRGEEEKPKIGDKIICKNCKAINQYEITNSGHLAITSQLILTTALVEEGQLKPGEGPIQFAQAGLMDGRRMSMDKMLEYYQKEIQKSPEDPSLKVGYGNVLIKAGMEDEAVRQYQEALRLDPLAVEAYASLGEFESDKGNPSGAYEYFRKAAERIHTGHYYRTKEIDQLKEAVILNRDHFAEVLGKTSEWVSGPPSPGIIKREKVGRNAPCPCGSGKKYKKCCLPKEEAERQEKTSATPKELELRDRLLSFSGEEKYKKDFEKAYSLYWRRPFRKPLVLDENKEEKFGLFLDWFIHDFKLGNGSTLIEEFYRAPEEKFSTEERSLLRYEMDSYCSIYEVLSVTPEVGMRLKDLLTEEELDVLEVRGTRTVAKWDVVFARVIRMGLTNKFSGIITLIPRIEKEAMLYSIRKTWEKFKGATGKEEWSSFAKLNAQLIHHILEDQPRVEPVFITEEHHRIVSAKAVFEVKNFATICYRLQQEFDFTLDEEEEGKKLQWSWLKRGKSKDWEAGESGEHSIILKSEMIQGKGELTWVSLGTVTLTPKKLELWCISKERLDRGKKRLKEVLGDDIQHQRDYYEDMLRKAREMPGRASSPEEETLQEKFLPLYSKKMSEWGTRWVDEKIPALDGKTPREALRTPEGKKKVEELLKDFENMEERKKRDGEPYIDIDVLRQMLNI
jgi:tetratricopeptide (TPR) repeat protein